ncbi:replication protein A 70 isoform X2 [Tachypleus tridentatus]|uniref:replication protein A 70 isoform X2 n=1 Tax=Tachypleus tridentatus TaxID=6853 RepID=UPI003FD5B4B3
MAVRLSVGSVNKILNKEVVEKPVLQILSYKQISGGGNERFRLLLSDGEACIQFAMLATQLNTLIHKGELERNTVICLDKYLCNEVQPGKRVVIILELTVLARGSEVGQKIGNPVVNPGVDPSHSVASSNASKMNAFQENRQTHPLTGGVISKPSPYASSIDKSAQTQVHPISSLTPYQNKWTIRARVTNKTPIKTWSNSRGEGKLFSMDLLDESGEIRATAFKEACDKFYDMIEINKVYYISKGSLKTANKQYTSIKNDYEITFNDETTVIPCYESVNVIPMLQFNFVPINNLEQVAKDSLVDVIGICKSSSDVQTLTSKSTNKELRKRDIFLVDQSGTEIAVTLWAAEAENFDSSTNPVVALKGVKVSDFSGCTLTTVSATGVQINPDIKEAHALRGWYDREGQHIQTQLISGKPGAGGMTGAGANWKTFAQAKAEMLGAGEKADYYTAKASVVMIRKENCMYRACPREGCQKKVIDMNNGLYRCEKCQCEYPNYKWRLLLQFNIADFSENQWVTCFQEGAETILKSTANDIGYLKESNEDQFSAIIDDANFSTYIFRLRTKMELYNEESRLKTVVVSVTPINPTEYGKKLLNDIQQMESVL